MPGTCATACYTSLVSARAALCIAERHRHAWREREGMCLPLLPFFLPTFCATHIT